MGMATPVYYSAEMVRMLHDDGNRYEDRPVPEFLRPAERGPTLPGYGRLAAAEREATTSGYAEVEGLVYDEETGKATLVAVYSEGPGARQFREYSTESTRADDVRH